MNLKIKYLVIVIVIIIISSLCSFIIESSDVYNSEENTFEAEINLNKPKVPNAYYSSSAYYLNKIGEIELSDSLYSYYLNSTNAKNVQGRTFFNIALIKDELLDTNNSRLYLRESILRGVDKKRILKFINRGKIKDSLAWLLICDNDFDSLNEIHQNTLDHKFIDFYQNLKTIDMNVRRIFYLSKKDNPTDSLTDCIRLVVSENMKYLYNDFHEYIINNKFPQMDEISYRHMDKLANLIIHFIETDGSFDFLESVMYKSIWESGLPPKYYTNFVDFYRNSKGQKDLYGTEIFVKDAFKNSIHRPILDISKADSLRKTVGLIPIYFDSISWGCTLPKEYHFSMNDFINDLRIQMNKN